MSMVSEVRPYQLIAELQPDDFNRLKQSIIERGIEVPIVVDENGEILDGHNRKMIADSLGIECPVIVRRGLSEPEKRIYAVELNVARRHMTDAQKVLLGRKIEPDIEARAEARRLAALNRGTERPVMEKFPERGTTRDEVARAVGIGTGRTYENGKKVLDEIAAEKDGEQLLHYIESGDWDLNDVRKELKDRRRQSIATARETDAQNAREIAETVPDDDRMTLLHGDILDAGAEIPDDSVDVIICDPPYGRQYLDTYDKLGELAARVLKPGGSVIAMAGQFTIIENLESLSAHLSYHWTVAYLTPGGQAPQIWPRKVNTFWKPLLWFTKGEYTGDWHGDVLRSDVNDNDKRFHHWGQSESGMARIIETFSKSNDLILDPFLGGGTTALVTLDLGRRFVGIDVSADAVATTRQRIASRRK